MAEKTEPHYQSVPHTLDPNRDIPEDALPSAGVSEEEAGRIRDADEAFTGTVQESAEAERKRQEDRDESGDPTPSQFARGARSKKEGEKLDKEQKDQDGTTERQKKADDSDDKTEKKPEKK